MSTRSSYGRSSAIRRLASFRRRRRRGVDRSTTTAAAARALDGLIRFVGGDSAAWVDVDWRFDKLTKDQGGVLYRSQFGQCIGMKAMEDKKKDGEGKTTKNEEAQSGFCCFFFGGRRETKGKEAKDDKETDDDKPDFAGELFDALNRRRYRQGDGITKDLMLEFWDQINDTSFDGRLQTFYDMVDKDNDGRISEEEIKQMIMLSASENKLSVDQKKAAEYARLIMESLDPYNLGYTEYYNLKSLLLHQSGETA